MGLSIFLARRLSLSSGGGKTSPAIRVAVAAVALSVMVMAAAIAIVLGFKDEITHRVAGFNSHISIYAHAQSGAEAERSGDPSEAINILTLTPTLRELLEEQDYVADYALQASIPAILKTPDDFKGVYLKSAGGRDVREFVGSSMVEGYLPDFSADSARNMIVVSRNAAERLTLKSGEDVDVYFISDQVRARRMKIAGVYDSHFESYDDAYAYGSLALIQELGGLSPLQGTSISISTDDFSRVEEYGSRLSGALVDAYTSQRLYKLYRVETARQQGAAYFQWLDMLDVNVVVVLVLMVLVACVTLVSGMLILMVDKVRFIALLAALGATRRQIGRVFMLLAAKIALFGLLLGDLLGVGFCLLEDRYHFLPLDADSYYMDFVPVRIDWLAIVLLNVGVLAIIWGALLLPSRFAGRAAPARTLSAE